MPNNKNVVITKMGDISEIVVLAGMNVYNKKKGCYENTVTEAVKYLRRATEFKNSDMVNIFIRNGIIKNDVLYEVYVGTYYPKNKGTRNEFRPDGMQKVRRDGDRIVFEQPMRPASGLWVEA